jgi:hypothetical protein
MLPLSIEETFRHPLQPGGSIYGPQESMLAAARTVTSKCKYQRKRGTHFTPEADRLSDLLRDVARCYRIASVAMSAIAGRSPRVC